MKHLNSKTSTKNLFITLVLATIMVVLICTTFIFQIRKTTVAETERYLSELSSSVMYSVDARLDANIEALESIASTYEEHKKLENKDDYAYLERKTKIQEFTNVFVMDKNGNAININGEHQDFSNIPQIMDTLSGKKTILNDSIIYGEIKHGFAYAVPLYEDGIISGALIASSTTEWIQNLLSQSYFNGEGFFHIIDENGEFIVKSNNVYSMSENKNFFHGLAENGTFNENSSLTDLKEMIDQNKKGTIYFTMHEDHVAKIGRINPLNTSGYYLSLIVTEDVASRQFHDLLFRAVVSNVVVSLLFIALVAVLFIVHNRNSKRLSKLAFEDPITLGFSPIQFEEKASSCILQTPSSSYTFISLNVVNFKIINDSLGVENGDKILKHIYNQVQRFLSEDEFVCRSFSDNFDLLLKEQSKEKILQRLTKISKSINAFNETHQQKYYILLTAGAYLIDDPMLPIVHIRDRANVARKSNKELVDNDLIICTFFSEPQRQKQLRNKDIENKMNEALEQGEFEVFFQPKVRLSDKKIVGAEALVRWRDKEMGLIPPNDFIPFFEQNRFIIQIDLFVFEQVCKCLQKWIKEGKEPVNISVNLSRVHLSERGFLSKFKRIIDLYQVPPHYLEIELTETVLSENIELVSEVIQDIHKMGVSCSIDDFGSGYSSLNLLKNIHADTLKLDRGFFDTPDSDVERERVIIESVIEMADRLHMTTVAEGIETIEQMEYLESIQCDIVQGYVFAKPMEAEVFENMLFNDH